MIFVLLAIASLLCLGILIHRHRAGERQKELSLMKRHADVYTEKHKSPW